MALCILLAVVGVGSEGNSNSGGEKNPFLCFERAFCAPSKNQSGAGWGAPEERLWNRGNLVGKLAETLWDRFGVCFGCSQWDILKKKNKRL